MKYATTFLQFVVVLVAVGAAAFLLWEPQLEGANAHATNFEIYSDPFILLAYAGSIPFFVALFHVFKLFRRIRQNSIFSPESVSALRTIRRCAITIIGFVIVEEIIILLNHGNDDAAGGVMIGLLIAFSSLVVAAAARMFEKLLLATMNT